MLYGNYRFKCRLVSDAHLPEYKGSTFRGVFGRALKQVVCALKRQDCPTCLLRSECLYPQIFEPELAISSGENDSQAAIPHPYVIQPFTDKQLIYPQGSHFNFDLLLFGSVNKSLPYFVYALDRMGQIGIGKKVDGRRARFKLQSVESIGRQIYNSEDQKLSSAKAYQDLNLFDNEIPHKSANSVSLTFETPLRLKHNNRLSAELQFHVLVRAMLRRVSSLLHAYDCGEPNLDYAGMVQRSGDVSTANSTLAWKEWRRYSLRQRQPMMMGGLKGSITYSGELDEFLPLIDFCSQVHIGKQTTFGLGRFQVEAKR